MLCDVRSVVMISLSSQGVLLLVFVKDLWNCKVESDISATVRNRILRIRVLAVH